MSERTRKLAAEDRARTRVSAEGLLTEEQLDNLLEEVASRIPSAVVWTEPNRFGVTADWGLTHREIIEDLLVRAGGTDLTLH